jgi:hypothetical protein
MAGELLERIDKAMKLAYKHIPVAFECGEEIFKLTDIYGHALVNDMLAGLPFDVVLVQKNPKTATEGEEKED